jgi:hypothetical protein
VLYFEENDVVPAAKAQGQTIKDAGMHYTIF